MSKTTEGPMYVEGFDFVHCPNCKLRVSPPFRASGLPRGHGAWAGQCTGQNGCKTVFYFDLKLPENE